MSLEAEIRGSVQPEFKDLCSKVPWSNLILKIADDVSTSVTLSLFWVLFAVFICSFMVAAPIFGYLGDRFNRKVILSCGIFFWSIVTLSSSFISKEVQHHIHLDRICRTIAAHEVRWCSTGPPCHTLHWRANYSVMLRICLMLRLVKWNETLVNSDTHFAFVDILYVPLPLLLTGCWPIS